MRLVRRELQVRGSVGEGILTGSSATLRQIAERVGTPVYVYDADAIRKSYHDLTGAFGDIPHQIFYSVKSNSNLSIVRLMRDLGAGADIVSGGELARTRAAGVPASKVVFSGVGKTRAELWEAVQEGVGLINVESWGEAELLGTIATETRSLANCGIRVNPDVTTDTHPYTQTGEHGMKFGVPSDDVVPIAEWADKHPLLKLNGLGMHIGSQITNAGNYRDGARKLLALYEEVSAAGVRGIQWLGVGGGLGIRYTDERALPAEEFVSAVRSLHDKTGLPLALEPGRFLVGNAGCLLTSCLYRKRSGSRDFVIVDAGMNDLLRPSLYDAKHRIVTVHGIDSGGSEEQPWVGSCDVVGPICESGDFLGLERNLDDVGSGALLAVLSSGAYGFSMSSNYNSRPRAAEVLLHGTDWRVIRKRETVEDLMRGEELAEGCPD